MMDGERTKNTVEKAVLKEQVINISLKPLNISRFLACCGQYLFRLINAIKHKSLA